MCVASISEVAIKNAPMHIIIRIHTQAHALAAAFLLLNIHVCVCFRFSKDIVREVAINDRNKNLVLSGGFDGNVSAMMCVI